MRLSDDGKSIHYNFGPEAEAFFMLQTLAMVNQNRKQLGLRPQALEEFNMTPELIEIRDRFPQVLTALRIPLTVAEAGEDEPEEVQREKQAAVNEVFDKAVEVLKPAVHSAMSQVAHDIQKANK